VKAHSNLSLFALQDAPTHSQFWPCIGSDVQTPWLTKPDRLLQQAGYQGILKQWLELDFQLQL